MKHILQKTLSKNYTKITALERSSASHRGLKDTLHCAQTFALDLGVILSTRNKHAPQKRSRVKKSKKPNWINQNIIAARKTRDSFAKSKNMAEYCLWRNRSTSFIQNTKKSAIPKVLTITTKFQNASGKICMMLPINHLNNKSPSSTMIMEILSGILKQLQISSMNFSPHFIKTLTPMVKTY